ncbi:hypothetical protein GALL_409510 [mine drainage metagenome]|uniref:Uncharacterized protein n=1 Tax=mine drainage metagenome TaxID=410659 RepID=A0A1J5Q0V9_9ZZZZ
MALAFKLEDYIHEVLKHPRTCDGTVLCHMADEDDGDVAILCDSDEGVGNLTHLGDSARGAFDSIAGNGLDAVHDQKIGLDRIDVRYHCTKIGFSSKPEIGIDGAKPLSPQSNLGS